MGLTAAILTPLVHHLIFIDNRWWTYAISALITYAAFFVVYVLVKALVLLISRDKRLEEMEARIPQLEFEIRDRKQKRFVEIQDDADFLWTTRTENDLPLWKLNQQRWVMYAPSVVADYCGIDKEIATKQLFDCSGMDSYETKAVLQRHIANLKTIATLRDN